MFTQIETRGADAVPFLQAQLTQDLARVTPERSPLAAWCNPKGRVIVVLRLLALDDDVGLVMPKALGPEVLRQLQVYRLRAKVEIVESSGAWRSLAVHGDDACARLDALHLLPARVTNASCRQHGVTSVRLDAELDCVEIVEIYGDESAVTDLGLPPDSILDATAWAAARIAAGIADIGVHTSGHYTPHMLNLDRLDAVSFNKGCYTGQEVIARTEYRGTPKRRLMHYRAAADVAIGDKLHHEDREVGEVVASSGRDFLALTPSDLHTAPLFLDGTPAHPVAPGC
jgi:hypothetical protein